MDIETGEIVFLMFCFVLFSLLCLVRKIEVFASTHLFANIMIVITLVAVIVQGTVTIGKPKPVGGSHIATIGLIEKTFADGIGYSVFAYEGIGVILPI